MLAADRHAAEQLDFVELIVAVGVLKAKQPRSSFASSHHIKAVESVKKPLGVAYPRIQRFNLQLACSRRQRNTVQLPTLVAGDEPAFVIDRHADPRSLFGTVDGVNQFHPKTIHDTDIGSWGELSGK